MSDCITSPFTVLVDGREKASYRFTGLQSDASKGSLPLIVPVQWAHLKTGDYSIDGMQQQVTVERKSLVDLYGTLGGHRDRFEAELQRMTEFDQYCIVVEASLAEIVSPELYEDDWRSQLNPKTVFRTMISWQQRYRVPWVFAGSRRLAEIYTFRFLEKFWKENRNG